MELLISYLDKRYLTPFLENISFQLQKFIYDIILICLKIA